MTISIFDDDSVDVLEQPQESVDVLEITDDVSVFESSQVVGVNEEGTMPVLDYRMVSHKPSIENCELVGNKTLSDIGINVVSNAKILDLFR